MCLIRARSVWRPEGSVSSRGRLLPSRRLRLFSRRQSLGVGDPAAGGAAWVWERAAMAPPAGGGVAAAGWRVEWCLPVWEWHLPSTFVTVILYSIASDSISPHVTPYTVYCIAHAHAQRGMNHTSMRYECVLGRVASKTLVWGGAHGGCTCRCVSAIVYCCLTSCSAQLRPRM